MVWALIEAGEVALVREEPTREVLTGDADGSTTLLTDAELAERGWVEIADVERPSDTHERHLVEVDGVWVMQWQEGQP